MAVGLLTLAAAASAGELLIEQRLAEDGALLVRYTPPEGVRELPLFDRSKTMATVWGEMATVLDGCATVALQPRTTLRLNEGCASAAVRMAPRVLNRRATYEPAFAIGAAAVMGYTGYYAVALRGHGLRWRWMPAKGGQAVVAGRMSTAPVDRTISAEQVAFAAQDEGRTLAGWTALAANEYSFLGKADAEALPGGVLIHDGRLDAARLDAVRATLGTAATRLTRAYGTRPAGPWAVVVSVASAVRGMHGDVTPGRMMSLRFNDAPPQDAASAVRQARWFVAHEATHWWDTGVFKTDHDRPWIHEGHADWMAGLLMLEAGHTDATGWRATLDAALNICLFARRDRPAANLPTGWSSDDDPYACGHVTWLLAQSRRPSDAAPVDMAASVFRGSTVPIDVQAVARWADGASSGAMRRLLLDPQQGWLSAIKRDWAGVIEAAELKAGDVLAQPLRGRFADALMRELMTADCGRVGLWTEADHFRIEAVPTCKSLRGDMRVRRIAGVSPFEDPVGAWLAVRAACTASQPIALAIDGTAPAMLACPSPAPEMPIRELLRLRPQAVERLGLAR